MDISKDTLGDADRRARLGGDPERGFQIWLSAEEVKLLLHGDDKFLSEFILHLRLLSIVD